MSFSSGTVIAGWTATIYEDDDLTSWSTEQESWIISIYVFGALIGALPAGFFSRKFGRKIFLLWLALPMTVGWIICLMQLSNVSKNMKYILNGQILYNIYIFLSAAFKAEP